MSADDQRSPRSGVCNREIMEIQMRKPGFPSTRPDLAAKAGLNITTINRAFAGTPIDKPNVHAIASALGLTYDQLTQGIYPPVLPEPDDAFERTETVIILNPNLPGFQLDVTVDNVRRMTGIHNAIKIERTEPGSIRLICKMRHSDILRLIAGMLDTDLSRLGVEGMQIANHWWMLRAIALIKVLNSPATPSDSSWSVLLNGGSFEFLNHKTPKCFFCREPPV